MNMRFRSIVGVFGKSPLEPLYHHAEKVCKAAEKLEDLVENLCRGDRRALDETINEISTLEFEADQIKQEVRSRVPPSILMPFERHDFLFFLKPQDSIADRAEDVAALVSLKQLPELPEDIKRGLREIAEKTKSAVKVYLDAVRMLASLSKASFRRSEIKKIVELVPVIERIEHEVDVIGLDLSRRIYELERDLSPVDVFLLSKIVSTFCNVTDEAAEAADRLRTMLIK